MLFMGEEWGHGAPFLFFTDHNEELAEAGARRAPRASSSSSRPSPIPRGARRSPIPNAATTFDASAPDASEATQDGHAAVMTLHRELLALRHRYVVPGIPGARSEGAEAIGPKAVVGRWRLGNGALLTIAVNLDETPVPIGPLTGEMLYGTGDHLTRVVPEGALPGDSAVVYVTDAGR